jgi:hypothetical protein
VVAGRSTRSLGVIDIVALKASIAKNVPGDQVTLKVPREFQSSINARRLGVGPYIVIAFPGMRGQSSSIVDSVTISRALAKVEGEPGTIVAVAHDFTAEAREILGQRSALYFDQREFFWTDASLASIRDKRRR